MDVQKWVYSSFIIHDFKQILTHHVELRDYLQFHFHFPPP